MEENLLELLYEVIGGVICGIIVYYLSRKPHLFMSIVLLQKKQIEVQVSKDIKLRMKIMHVVVDFPPLSIGGMEAHVYYLGRELSKLGMECIVIHGAATQHLIKGKNRYQRRPFPLDCLRVKRIASINILGKTSCFMPSLPLIIKDEKPDILHVHGYWNIYTIQVGLIAFFSKIPCILTVHGIGDYRYTCLSRRLILSIHENVMHHILPLFNKIIAVSSHTKKELEVRGCDQGKVVMIPNGISSNPIILPSGEASRKKLSLSSEKIILSIGRITESKGYQYMIEAMPLVTKGVHNVIYLIIGADTGYKRVLERKVKVLGLEDRVRFLGFVTEEEKMEALSAASIVVIPSLHEGLPLVLLEAIEAKKPIVATNVGGIPEIIQDDELGILVPACNSFQIAYAIIKLLTNEIFFDSMCKSTKEKLQIINWMSVAIRTKDLYSEIVSKLK